MSDRDELAARVRGIVAMDERISERAMFGGLGYFINRNMFLGVTSKGELMARTPKGDDTAVRSLPGATSVDFTAKRMAGFLIVSADAIEEEENLEAWVNFCLTYTATLPPKP